MERPEPIRTALMLLDLQNDFMHADGAYGRAGVAAAEIAALPARLAPVVTAARAVGVVIVSTHFTLVPGRDGEPLISEHLAKLRPFLAKGDFAPGGWGQALIDELAPSDVQVEKVAFSAFHASRLDWVLRKLGVEHLICAGIVTNGGVASTIRDAHVREYRVTVIEDGCAAFTTARHDASIADLASLAEIVSCTELQAALALP